MKSRISVEMTVDQERLAYLLENRLVSLEELNCSDAETKSLVKTLLLKNALKGHLPLS